jgi:hypothetical protein
MFSMFVPPKESRTVQQQANREKNEVPQMENGKWQIQRWMFTATLTVFSKAVCHPLPEGPPFRRRVAENAYTVMLGETRILFSFPAQPALETVGCVALFDAPVTDRRLGALKNATHPTRDINGTALG